MGAGPVGGGGAWPSNSQQHKPHWCGGHREGLEGQAAVPVGGGGAWPGFETTRRAKLAARTARGRAAAHGHTKQPGLTKHTRRPEHPWRHKQQNAPPRMRKPRPADAGRGFRYPVGYEV